MVIKVTVTDCIEDGRLRRIVHDDMPAAWRSGRLLNRPYDGTSTFDYFTKLNADERVGDLVRFFIDGGPWLPLVQDLIDKSPEWKAVSAWARNRAPAPAFEKRPVTLDCRRDHAAQLVLKELVEPSASKLACPVAIGFRKGKRLDHELLDAISLSRAGLFYGATLDVRRCFESFHHGYMFNQIDLLHPWVHEAVLKLLKGLVVIPVFDRLGREVVRQIGVPQGGVLLAPTLCNVYFATFDARTQKRLAALRCLVRRWADDLLVLAPTIAALNHAVEVVREELQRVHLAIKGDHIPKFDVRNGNNPFEWLGLAATLDRTFVPRSRLERKAAGLLLELLRGELATEDLEDRLDALQASYDRLTNDHEAARARSAVQKLLLPFLHRGPAPRGDLHHLRSQLSSLLGRSP